MSEPQGKDELLLRAQLGLYRALILLLPPPFRRRAGSEMVDVFRSHLCRRVGVRHALRVWGVGARDLIETGVAEWRRLAFHQLSAINGSGGTTRRGEKGAMFDHLRQDLRFASRTFARQPGVILAAVATLALGVGGSTAIFSVVRGVLIKTLSYPDGDRVVYVTETTADGRQGRTSYENFRDWQSQTSAFEALAIWINNSTNVTGSERPERIRGMFVTASYFDVAGVHPFLGREIAPGEDEPGGPSTAVLSHGFWQRRYGGDVGVLGQSITLNNIPHEIVGVMPAGFKPVWGRTDAWISLPTLTGWTFDRASKSLPVMARLKPGVSVARAQEALAAVQAGLRESYPVENRDRGVLVQALAPIIQANMRPTLMMLLTAAGIVLLIGCANVANLQLTRSMDRIHEVGIRAALGGGRRRIVTQMLTESMLLATLGGLAGVALSYAGVNLLVSLQPNFAQFFDVEVDGLVLAAGMGLALVTGIVFGTIPALKASKIDLATALREGERGGSASGRAKSLRIGLVVAQTSLTVMLLVGSGLLLRSAAAVEAVDPGFNGADLLTLEFRLPPNKYETLEAKVAFFDRMLERVGVVTGVRQVASAGSLPFSGNGGVQDVFRTEQDPESEEGLSVQTNAVSPDYLAVMEIPLLAGRGIEPTDRLGADVIGLASLDLAERFWPGEDPIGRIVTYNEGDEAVRVTVVGVTGEVRVSLTQDPRPHLYVAYAQRPTLLASLAVRATSDPLAVANAVREAVWEVDPDQPVWEIMLIEERISGSLGSRRFFTVLLTVFGGVALVLGSVGIYGVMGYAVGRRSREIGVRIAFGARGGEIRTMVLREGLLITLGGVMLGLLGAAALSRVLSASLFQVSPHDPTTFLVVPVLLTVVAAVACYLPARRATKVDPVRALSAG